MRTNRYKIKPCPFMPCQSLLYTCKAVKAASPIIPDLCTVFYGAGWLVCAAFFGFSPSGGLMKERAEFLRIIKEAAAHLRAWRKIGLSIDSGAFEDWDADTSEAFRGLLGDSDPIAIQVSSLINGIKRRVKLGMEDDVALASLAPEIEELASKALGIAEENPPHVRTLGDVGTMVEAQRLYDPSFGTLQGPKASPGGEVPDPRKVFVVRGRNRKLSTDFFSFLRALGLHPLEWEEAIAGTGKASPYVGEVLDFAFSAGAAIVVLLSPDDEVRLSPALRSEEMDPTNRRLGSRLALMCFLKRAWLWGEIPTGRYSLKSGKRSDPAMSAVAIRLGSPTTRGSETQWRAG